LIERGAKLRDVAALWELPMRLRRITPGAAHLVSDVLVKRPELLDYMPLPLPQMRQWLRDIYEASHAYGQEPTQQHSDYAAWVARNWAKLDGSIEIEDLRDWIYADVLVEQPFVPSMSVQTVRRLSNQWHEAVTRLNAGEPMPFPEPWFQPHTLTDGERIIPLTNNVDLVCEGQAMHHCISRYVGNVLRGQTYIYSLRKGDQRIATIELWRDGTGKAKLGQVRGAYNAMVSINTMATIVRWLVSLNNPSAAQT
jgi:hypothetical protein